MEFSPMISDVSDLAAGTFADKKETNTKKMSIFSRNSCNNLSKEFKNNQMARIYWAKRHQLFSKFDEGIYLDEESWYSVTPEQVAIRIAERCKCGVVVDAFCGAGGNAIQFAKTCKKVIAIDIDPTKIKCAMLNASVYGVLDRIEFICGDFFKLAPQLRADVVFLSPPWGGPNYKEKEIFMLEDLGDFGVKCFEVARQITTNIVFYLPKNVCIEQIVGLANRKKVELEHNVLNYKVKSITTYFGNNLVQTDHVLQEGHWVESCPHSYKVNYRFDCCVFDNNMLLCSDSRKKRKEKI